LPAPHIDDKNPNGWVPAQKITVEEALIAYTRTAAYASFEENLKGSLQKGKLADFVMSDKDLTSIRPETIRSARVMLTVVGGKVVHDSK
jgi:predicted amidohydrolase YtcJ